MTQNNPYTSPSLNRSNARNLKKAFRRATALREFPARVVGPSPDREGYTVVELSNGQEIEVFNPVVPNIEGLRVKIAYSPANSMLQVTAVRQVYVDGMPYLTPEHARSHQYPNEDILWVAIDQFLPLLVLPVEALTVQIYGAVVYAGGVWGKVENQTLDLSASQPAAAARWVLIQTDGTGTISTVEGSTVASKALLTYANIPTPTTGNLPLCAVKLYAGQTVLSRNTSYGGINDFADVRMSGYALDSDSAQNVDWNDILNIPAEFNPDTDVTDLLYPRKWYAAGVPGATDDEGAGYSKADLWINTSLIPPDAYICLDNTNDAAVWLHIGTGSGSVVFGVAGVLAVLDNVPNAYIFTAEATIDEWYLYLKETGTAGTTIVDILCNGVSIFEDLYTDNRPTIAWDDADGQVTATPLTTEFVAGDVLTFNIDQVATGAADAVCVGGSIGDGGSTATIIDGEQGFMINGKIVTSVASNNLTVAIKTLAGNDPSPSDPVYIRIGNARRTLTAALSVTKNAGTNWMNAGSSELATQEIDYFVYLGYNATDGVMIGFARIPYGRVYGDFDTTSTNEHYCAISTIANAVSTDEYELVGRFNAVLSAGAGYTWSIPATSIVLSKPVTETRWLTWQPTYSGGGSMTYTSVTNNLVRYQVRGRNCHFTLHATGTTGGTASTTVLATLPFSNPNNQDIQGCGIFISGGVRLTARTWVDLSTNTVSVGRYDASNWTLGASRTVNVHMEYEIG